MTDNEEMDAEANRFAIELLMPERMVRNEVSKLRAHISFVDDTPSPALEALAKKFKVSTIMMILRLTELYPDKLFVG